MSQRETHTDLELQNRSRFIEKNWLKFIIGWLAVLLIRLLPFRPPNIEPVLATVMPFSKRYGYIAGFLFAFLSIVIFDTVTQTLGSWTFITATTYGVVALGAYLFLKKRKPSARNFFFYSIIGTLFFDAVTGLSIGPLFFGQPFMQALIGQIPFTMMHLGGNAAFALVLSPLLYRWVVVNEMTEPGVLWRRLRTLSH